MMTKVPFRCEVGLETVASASGQSRVEHATPWQAALPEFVNDAVTLREIRRADAPSLLSMLATPEVRRFMSSPPETIAGFERFIEWAQTERQAGRYLCFAVVPKGYDVAIGIFQVRQVDRGFTIGEWGAAFGSQFWGTGLFEAAAKLLFDFLFDEVGLHRLEARASVQNGRANGAARKMGSVPEGVVRQGLVCRGQHHDQLMWSLLAEDWRELRTDEQPMVH
jgi:ribosomal-protein-alanine N-acetyltransferase